VAEEFVPATIGMGRPLDLGPVDDAVRSLRQRA
jgi:hypothetical protein